MPDIYADASSAQALRISAVIDQDAGFRAVPAEELGENFNADISYMDVTDVSIRIGNEVYPLEAALRDGLTSEMEIFYHARLDTKNGFCEEVCESRFGLTHFTYMYPGFDLRIIHDIYETPDGQQHLISDLGIYPPGEAPRSYVDFKDQDTGYRLDREDWGLTIEVVEASPSEITLRCTQREGQHIGELVISNYSIYAVNLTEDNGDVEKFSQVVEFSYVIPQETSSEFTVKYEENFGELPPGEYEINFCITDEYDKTQLHPLMRNYHDMQPYWYDFTVAQ